MVHIMVKKFLLFCCIAGLARSEPVCPDEQACTRFTYEYQLLQRLIRLEMEKVSLEERVKRLENPTGQDTVLVHFNAMLSKSLSVTPGFIIPFDTVISNTGDAYNPADGKFTSPVNGVYLFAVTICPNNGHYIGASMFNGEVKLGEVRAGDSSWKECASDTVATYLVKGDRVYVKVTLPEAAQTISKQHWNTFTGVLVQRG